jgi:hypothetical protein
LFFERSSMMLMMSAIVLGTVLELHPVPKTPS